MLCLAAHPRRRNQRVLTLGRRSLPERAPSHVYYCQPIDKGELWVVFTSQTQCRSPQLGFVLLSAHWLGGTCANEGSPSGAAAGAEARPGTETCVSTAGFAHALLGSQPPFPASVEGECAPVPGPDAHLPAGTEGHIHPCGGTGTRSSCF